MVIMIQDLVKIVGTGHVFKESAQKVRKVILEERPNVVAVELDRSRYIRLLNREYGTNNKNKKRNLLLNPWAFILSKAQTKLGNQFGMAPGGDMIAAIKAAKSINARIALIDQDIQKTMDYISKAPFKEKLGILREVLMFFTINDSQDKIKSDNIELNNLMDFFKQKYPYLFKKLVQERNRVMGRQILEILKDINHLKKPSIVAVVGMGHSKGIKKYLRVR